MISLGIDIGGSSIKAAAMQDGAVVWTRQSAMYSKPSRAELIGALRGVCDEAPDAIGLCVPGLFDRLNRKVTLSVNIPALEGESLDALLNDSARLGALSPSPGTPGEGRGGGRMLAEKDGPHPNPPPEYRERGQEAEPRAVLLTDAHAAAYDLYTSRELSGRLLMLALGTGVGASVYDEAGLLHVDDESPGHFGQMDVSIDNAPVIGPDGGAGSLEGYIGAAVLRQRYGDDFASRLDEHSPALRALARAIRIGHAIYRPHHICLAGGVGLALKPVLPMLRDFVARDLTRIARVDWTLTCADHPFHAAIGAACLVRDVETHPTSRE